MTEQPNFKPILFALPEYDRAFVIFVRTAVNALAVEMQPVLKKMPRAKPGEVTTSQNTTPDGTVVAHQPFLVTYPFTFNTQQIIDGDLDDAIGAAVHAAAEEGAKTLVHHLLGHIGSISDAFGNTIKAEGRPISADLLLDMFENIEIEFGADGQPDLDSWVMVRSDIENGTRVVRGTYTFQQLMEMFPFKAEQQNRFSQLIKAKREKYNAGKRNRKLY